MKRAFKFSLVLYVLLVGSVFGQSVEINPSSSTGFIVSKKTTQLNKTVLEGQSSATLEISAKKSPSNFDEHGSANMTLRSEHNFSSFSSLRSGISFFNGTTKRWYVGDLADYDPSSPNDDFIIEDNNTAALRISKNDNQTVFVKNLGIMSMNNTLLEGKTLQVLADGRIGASANQVIVVGAYDLVSETDTVFVRGITGSYIPNNSNKTLYVPLHLPQGSNLEKLTVTYKDNSSTDGISVFLVEHNGSTESFLAEVSSTNENSASITSKSPSSYFSSAFDNKIKQYYLKISPRNQATSGTGRWRSTNITFVKAVIEVK